MAHNSLTEKLLRTLLVRETEAATFWHFFGFFLITGAGIALGRGSADALFFKRYGIEYLPVMYLFMSGLLAISGLLYAAYADRLPAERLFIRIFSVIAGLLVIEWTLMRFSEVEWVYPLYFLSYEIASEVLLVHGALYMNQNLNTLQSKRLVPLIIAGTQLGAMSGGLLLAGSAGWLGVENILPIWFALLLAGMLILLRWHRRYGISTHYRAQHRSARQLDQAARQIFQTVQLTRRSDLLRAASVALFFMVVTFYILSYSVNRVYTQHFEQEASLAIFFGLLSATTGGIALLFQLFVSNRVIEKFGVQKTNLLFPLSTIASFGGLLTHFGFAAALFGSFNKDTVMPAFRKPVRAIIYNALPHAIQGRARAMSVVLVLPLALLVCGGILWAVQRLDDPVYFLAPGFVCALLYLFFSIRMNRAYVSALIEHLRDRLFLPEDAPEDALRGSGTAGLKTLTDGVMQADETVALSFARTLAASFPAQAPDILLRRLDGVSIAFTDQVLIILRKAGQRIDAVALRSLMDSGDAHLRATIQRFLNDTHSGNIDMIGGALDDPSARVRAAGICGAFNTAEPGLHARSLQCWQALFESDPATAINAFTPITIMDRLNPEQRAGISAKLTDAMNHLCNTDDLSRVARTLAEIPVWPLPTRAKYSDLLARLLDEADPDLRVAAISSLAIVPIRDHMRLLRLALDDPHPKVRKTAVDMIVATSPQPRTALLDLLGKQARIPPRGQLALLETLTTSDIEIGALLDIARSKTELAGILDEAITIIERHPDRDQTGPALLMSTLKERCRQVVDLALLALMPVGNTREISTIRVAISSGDRCFIANASEALCNAEFPEVCQLLARITGAFTEDSHSSGGAGVFPGIQEVINWCESHGDAWMQTCARQARLDLAPDTTS